MALTATAPPLPEHLVRRWTAQGLRTEQRPGWVLEHAARRRPDDAAIITADGRHTLGQLRDRADMISWALANGGAGAGDVVTWSLPNGVEAIATAIAIWRIGAISNPVVPIYREHELAFIAGQLRPAAVISATDVRGRAGCEEMDLALAAAGHEPRLRLALGAPAGGGRWAPLPQPDPERPPPALPEDLAPAPAHAPCLVLYTSGTTAQPKGVVHSGCALVHEAFSMQREWGLTYRETMVMASPLPHITGILQGLLVPCLAGARVLLTDRWDPEACVELIEREGGTYMAGATPFLRGVLDAYAARGPGRPQLRQFCCGGAPVSPALIEEAQRAGIVAHRSWGLTELPSATFSRTIDPLRQRAETDGRPGEGIEVEAVDDERAPLPRGAEGELRIRGPERMEGYVDAALNAGAMDDDGWVYTGDVGLVDRDGCVRVTGRLKDIVNRGGEKLSAREIEELLERHDSIREAAVVPVPDERLGETVGAAVVLRPGDVLDLPAILRFLRGLGLASQKLPARVQAVNELPRTPSGKLQKHLVLRQLGEEETRRTGARQ
ncbi:AMP-binding protein [Capillimicrobium parvum]|uniref:Medium-chain fatty-acid--CoA ligase n=1 Tax=Capillimicrobium parvum TaxID=2884022 RepID=A0A9E7BZ00_9ACTN|nr:AMP-binding protein [Capillimicrobium parvum]UGS34816.1 Medium-chain fatty-acid--CoA ligase [Capillimicrobium parvum]